MTKHPDLFADLAAPFDPHEVKVRSTAGRQLHYITARTVMNRLDNVLGPENWWDDYTPLENSVLCRLTIRLPDGSTLTKSDAGGYAGMADSGDDDKSGYSDSFKRAAVKFGTARYLYRDGVPTFVQERVPYPAAIATDAPGKPSPVSTPEPKPPVPIRADPVPKSLGWVHGEPDPRTGDRGRGTGDGVKSPHPSPPSPNPHSNGKPPTTGKGLFRWVKDAEQTYQVGFLKYLNSWAKLQDFPGRMIDWDADQVAMGYAEATRKLRSLESQEAPS